MPKWEISKGNVYYKWDLGPHGLHYCEVLDTTHGHYSYGHFKVLSERQITAAQIISAKGRSLVEQYLPPKISFDELVKTLMIQREKAGLTTPSFLQKRKPQISTQSTPLQGKKPSSIEKIFLAYLEQIDLILHGHSFLHVLKTADPLYNSKNIFNFLLQTGIYDQALHCKFVDEKFIQIDEKIIIPKDFLDSSPIKKIDLEYSEFISCLYSILTLQKTNHTAYWSPQNKNIKQEEAKRLVDPIELFFMFESKNDWSYYKLVTDGWTVMAEGNVYFQRGNNDSCYIMTDHKNYFLTLFTTGGV